MRFLMLNWRDPKNPKSGGAERVTQAYLAALVRRGHQASLFTFDFPGAAREEILEGVQIVRGGGTGTAIFKAIQWYRRQPRFDLVIDQHHGLPWYAPWWCRTNCVAYIHEVLGPIWNAFYPWPLSLAGRWQERWTHWLYRAVPFFTASQATKKLLHFHGVKEVTIIPYGVHTRALAELEEKAVREPIQLIVVSRLAPNKRIGHAIEALRHLLNRGVPAELTIVGTGDEESHLLALVQSLDLNRCVTFTGSLSELEKDARLRASHLLLHTSLREGWGLNIIEANAMGTPAVVYPVEGLTEATLHDETGLVSNDEAPAALAASIATLAKDPERYQRHRRNAWNRAKTFHWDNVLPQACDWLELQAAKPRTRR